VALRLVKHPLVDDVLARLRDKTTPCDEFRALARRVSLLLAVEATRDLQTYATDVDTPLERTSVQRCDARRRRAGAARGPRDARRPSSSSCPGAEVGYFGLERNEETAAARRYYEKVPKNLATATVFLLDPMLATGGSAAMAVDGLRGLGATSRCGCSRSSRPRGRAPPRVHDPDVQVYTAALDRALNSASTFLPGSADFGDRLYGT
jgi:uracil phosphoribosyltransferase